MKKTLGKRQLMPKVRGIEIINKKITILTAILLLSAAVCSYAQVPGDQVDRATRDVDRQVREKVEDELTKPPQQAPVIKEEKEKIKPEGPKVFVKDIRFEGLESLSEEDLVTIASKYEGRDVYFSELEDMAREIQAEYLRRGIVASAMVPPQEVKDGIVAVQVVESRM
ncbi:MAG: POTRA domain-containing protein, partial [Candidatus Omnitrophota bacterium]